MGIAERIEEKLDLVLSLLQSGQSTPLLDFTEGTTIQGTAPQEPQAVNAVEFSGELDLQGFPWDARIHASSKEKVAAGTWKYKRGVEQNVKDAVENEFRAAGFGNKAAAAASGNVPGAGAAQPVVTHEPQAAVPQTPAAPAGVNLPGLSLPTAPAPVAAPEPVKVAMPAYVQGAELDDSQITAVAAAAYATLGETGFGKLQALFKMAPGTTIVDLPAEYRDSFHAIASNPELLAHYQIV